MTKPINIAITADNHLIDSLFSKNRFHEFITEIINKNKYSFVWFIGDIFHKPRNSDELIVFFNEEMYRLIDAKILPRYIEGNHERRKEDDYLITQIISRLVPIKKLPQNFTIHKTTFHAYGHDVLNHLTKNNITADILLSHLRWNTSMYEGELTTKQLKKLSSQYKDVLLGDIHYEYEPEHNVKYINSPYNINYGAIVPRGYIDLEVDRKGYSITRVHTNLPNKIEITCTLDELSQTIEDITEDAINIYKIKVAVESESDLPFLQTHNLVGKNYFVVHTFTGKEFLEDDIALPKRITGVNKAFEEAIDKDDIEYVKSIIDR